MTDVFKDPGNSWWTTRRLQALIAVVVVLVVIWAVSLVLSVRGDDEADRFDAYLVLVANQLLNEYIEPGVSQPTDAVCRSVPPGSSNPECIQFVGVIRESNPRLAAAVTELEVILLDAPSGTSQSLLFQTQQMLGMIATLTESIELLSKGWATRDQGKWQEGWALRESLTQAIEALSASAMPVTHPVVPPISRVATTQIPRSTPYAEWRGRRCAVWASAEIPRLHPVPPGPSPLGSE